MIANQHAKLAQNNLLEITIAGIANSRKMLFNELGLPFDSCIEELHQHGATTNLQQFVEKMKELNLSNSIFIDCTSSGEVIHYYEAILNSNISIVTPNKKANSGSYENYQLLKSTAFKRGVKFLYETNVGAGLPVINTLNDLLLSGDRVIRIEAVLSGTLNFIFSCYDGGKKFSDVVKEAQAKGYTEPDPRDDLNGMDVARKILILARETGLKLEMEDVSIENLVPQDCRDFTSVGDFYSGLETHDIEVEQQVKKATAKKEKLRYMAVLENGKAETKLVGVGETHPFYSLAGSDNIILLTTERYSDRPMVIRGPGAGAEVTAAGVFADVIRIGNYAGN